MKNSKDKSSEIALSIIIIIAVASLMYFVGFKVGENNQDIDPIKSFHFDSFKLEVVDGNETLVFEIKNLSLSYDKTQLIKNIEEIMEEISKEKQ